LAAFKFETYFQINMKKINGYALMKGRKGGKVLSPLKISWGDICD
jgi:hypothetical protein